MSMKYKLPKEITEKWVTALRSGEYGQTTRLLTDFNDNYCCLGVLCKTLNVSDEDIGYNNKSCIAFGQGSIVGIPKGLDEGLHKILTEMNDSGKSFSEIADWIEENVELV